MGNNLLDQYLVSRDLKLRNLLAEQLIPTAERTTSVWIQKNGGDYATLLSEALHAVVTAVDSYDPDRGATLVTWAITQIRFALRAYEKRGLDRATPIPERIMIFMAKRDAIISSLTIVNEQLPANNDIAAAMDLSEEAYLHFLRIAWQFTASMYLSDPVNQAHVETEVGDTISDRTDRYAQKATQLLIWDTAQRTLLPRELQALVLSYIHGYTSSDIGVAMCVSQSRANKLIHTALIKLKRVLPDYETCRSN